MAITLENLIDLELLTYYDNNIKRWIVDRINKQQDNIVFVTEATLPVEGQKGILYITEKSMYIWNGAGYSTVGNPEGVEDSATWGTW